MNFKFEHDPLKAAANLRNHGVSFNEAATSFFDTAAISELDADHSTEDDRRFINLGMSTRNRLLFVVHNEEAGIIRIISARLASPAQRKLYEES
jgi:uncharacterized DUF497 family protein